MIRRYFVKTERKFIKIFDNEMEILYLLIRYFEDHSIKQTPLMEMCIFSYGKDGTITGEQYNELVELWEDLG